MHEAPGPPEPKVPQEPVRSPRRPTDGTARLVNRLTGWTAILCAMEYGQRVNCRDNRLTDAQEQMPWRLALEVSRDDPALVYIDVAIDGVRN